MAVKGLECVFSLNVELAMKALNVHIMNIILQVYMLLLIF